MQEGLLVYRLFDRRKQERTLGFWGQKMMKILKIFESLKIDIESLRKAFEWF